MERSGCKMCDLLGINSGKTFGEKVAKQTNGESVRYVLQDVEEESEL